MSSLVLLDFKFESMLGTTLVAKSMWWPIVIFSLKFTLMSIRLSSILSEYEPLFKEVEVFMSIM